MAETQLTTYIALFHHRDHAAAALKDLERSGFGPEAVTVIGGGNGKSYSEAGSDNFGQGYGYGSQEELADIGVPDGDREHLQDGLEDGGTVLALHGAGDRAKEIEKIFHQHSTKKIDEADVDRKSPAAEYAAPLASAAPVAGRSAVTDVESAVIPIVEEQLVVGKREVDRGGVRVFRRVVEEPVSAEVTLHEEHVVLDRTPVNRAVTDADLTSGDRVLELTETAEEAVVGKVARVVEEVRVGKEGSDHTETIRDSVRHTEIDVEQVAGVDTTTRSTY